MSRVASEPASITFSHFDDDNLEQALAIIDAGGAKIIPREDTVFSGEYPLSVVYYMHISPKSVNTDGIIDYANYLMDESSQQQLEDLGFVALPDAIRLRNKIKLQQLQPEIAKGYK